jgi:hypothetical protein
MSSASSSCCSNRERSVSGRSAHRCDTGPINEGRLPPREEPVCLSDSRLETHQHWSPADASCCQSLLLDPDATISIDLHKRLFLLVSGRGELSPDFPYHGCALPTELGGQVTILQLGTDIVAATPMKRPINRALTSIQRRRCYRITAASTQQRPPHQLPCAVHRPRSRHLTPPASRPERAATQGLRPGNPMAPGRTCGP